MDGISYTAPPKQRSGAIFFIGVIITVLLLLLLLVLNYFNILPLSPLFPNQLGWMPQKSQPSPPLPASIQDQNFSSNTFKYDTEKAKAVLTQYIKETIKSEFIPEDLEINNNNRQLGSNFTTAQATFSINFHYKENTNTPNDFSIFIQPNDSESTTLTPDIANSLVSSYFNKPYSPISNCGTKGTVSYCEEFRTENDGKRGFGALIGQDPTKSPSTLSSIVFTCFIPKESEEYNTQNSCISL